jgi:hypothetical protein
VGPYVGSRGGMRPNHCGAHQRPEATKYRRYRQFIEDDIAHEKRIRVIIVNAIGEPKRRRQQTPLIGP